MPINLSRIPTTAPKDLDKDDARKATKKRARRIAELHQQLVAEGKHSVLIILQGMDASGKDGAMRNVFGECMPFGLRAVGWKKPTDLEFAHDFLWRIHKEAPAKGEMVIFNRSHYEDVLIQRVHGWIDEERVDRRIESINAWDKYRAAYEDVIDRSEIPWHIVGVDQRWYRDYVMTEIVVNALENLKMEWPGLETEMDFNK